MKKTLLILSALLVSQLAVNAQGKWAGGDATFKYNFSAPSGGKAKLNGGSKMVQSVSLSGGEAGLLPSPEKGGAKLSIDEQTGAAFALQGKAENVKLKMVASAGKPSQTAAAKISKFALYKLPSSAVTTFSFDIDINSYGTNGEIMIPFGNTNETAEDNATIFNNGAQMSEWWDTKDLFGAIKLDVYEGAYMAYSYRQPRLGAKDIEAPKFVEVKEPTPFNKGKLHAVEIYCNNSSKPQTYSKDGGSFEVAPQAYQWWVNGKRVKASTSLGDYDIPSSKETAVGNAVNSISFNTSGSTTPRANALEFTLSNIAVNYIK